MTTLTLLSSQNYPLRSFVEAAVAKELQELDNALQRSQERMCAFEEQYQLSTDEFVARYAADEIDETLETIEWYGEYRMAQHIQEKIDGVRGIEFAH